MKRFKPGITVAVVRTARPFGGCEYELAEDLTQEAFVRLCRNNYEVLRRARIPEPAALHALVRSVAVSATFDHFRKVRALKRFGGVRVVSVEETQEEHLADPPANGAERSVLLSQIDAKVKEVVGMEHPERDRAIFWLHYRHGLSARAIAAIPSISLSTKGVESVLQRIVKALKLTLNEKQGFDAGFRLPE